MKKISMILMMAFALAMTMSQCKKNEGQPTSNDEVVTITLDVNGASAGSATSGSRVLVNPLTGTVDFETGDKIYVGSGGKYVGFLTHNGTNFVGNITNPTENQPLQFYFLGNVTPTETLAAGTTEECSVIISDQTEHLPVISCAASNGNYVSGVTAYSAHLLNKCALVRFNVTTPSNLPICITGMKNRVMVDFTQNTVTPSIDGEGVIKLPAGAGENVEKWAILLPQEAVDAGGLGSAYSVEETIIYSGVCGTVPTIIENSYQALGIEVVLSVMHTYVDLGLPSGLLWATCNVGADTPEMFGNSFSWGEVSPKNDYGWNYYQYGGYNTLTKYCNNSGYGYNGYTDDLTILLPVDDASTVNWGSKWRMPTKTEWEELYQNTICTWTTQSGIKGRLFTASNGNSVFLPAAGYLLNSSLIGAGNVGFYWSSSLFTNGPHDGWFLQFNSDEYYMNGCTRNCGLSIRPVCSGQE